MDQLLNAFQAMDSKFQAQQRILNSHMQSIEKFESQIRQIANTLNRRDEGRLPGQVVGNPKGQCGIEENPHEQAKAITTLRSGKMIDNRVGEHVMIDSGKDNMGAQGSAPPSPPLDPAISESSPPSQDSPLISPTLRAYIPKAPFP